MISNKEDRSDKKFKEMKRYWVRPLFDIRNIDGVFATRFKQMYLHYHEKCQETVRMNTGSFDSLYEVFEDQLHKNSIRSSLAGKCKPFLTLV